MVECAYAENCEGQLTPDIEVAQQRTDDVARAHGVERTYGSYGAILEDRSVDVAYVASPHPSISTRAPFRVRPAAGTGWWHR